MHNLVKHGCDCWYYSYLSSSNTIFVFVLLLTVSQFELSAVCPAEYSTLVRRQSCLRSQQCSVTPLEGRKGVQSRRGFPQITFLGFAAVRKKDLPWVFVNSQRVSCIGSAVGSTTECSGWFSKHNFHTDGDNSSHQIAECHKAGAGKSWLQPLCSPSALFPHRPTSTHNTTKPY